MGSNACTFRAGYRGSLAERMAAKTRRGAENECWIWIGSRDTSGYGLIKIDGRSHHANRVAYERAHGPIPDGQLVLHRCDNPPCVNPNHLFTGTKQDNSDDKIAKGRGRWLTHEQHPRAKLTSAQVIEVRALHAEGGYTLTALGERFGVHRQTVRRIVRFENWR